MKQAPVAMVNEPPQARPTSALRRTVSAVAINSVPLRQPAGVLPIAQPPAAASATASAVASAAASAVASAAVSAAEATAMNDLLSSSMRAAAEIVAAMHRPDPPIVPKIEAMDVDDDTDALPDMAMSDQEDDAE
jgi:hypothetical protein